MQGVIISTTECLLFINMAFILASFLETVAELQFFIKDFMRRLKIFIVLVLFLPNLECGVSLCRRFVVLSVILFAIIFLFNKKLAQPKP